MIFLSVRSSCTQAALFPDCSTRAEEYPARQLSLTGPLLGLNATSAPGGEGPREGGLWVRYFGPQPRLVDEDDEEPQVGTEKGKGVHTLVQPLGVQGRELASCGV